LRHRHQHERRRDARPPARAAGARLTTLLHEVAAQRGTTGGYGLVTLCVGVGQGEAAIVEKL
jgi:acetyl-CoA C-acetyltransferase